MTAKLEGLPSGTKVLDLGCGSIVGLPRCVVDLRHDSVIEQ